MSKAEALISAKLRQSYENDLQAMVVSKVGIPIPFYLSYIILDFRVLLLNLCNIKLKVIVINLLKDKFVEILIVLSFLCSCRTMYFSKFY